MASPVNAVERALVRICAELDRLDLEFALVGGLAVSALTEPRTTRDVDMAVSCQTDQDAEQAVFELQESGYVVQMLLEHEPTGRMATVRLKRESEPGVYVDLLFASSGIEQEIVNAANRIEFSENLSISVAARPHLIAMKTLARNDRQRPQDWDDLRALVRTASAEELSIAVELLSIIENRGFNRSRDLRHEFARFLGELDSGAH